MSDSVKSSIENKTGTLSIQGYGFKIELDNAGQVTVFDSEDNAITDMYQRVAAQKEIIPELITRLSKSWEQELDGLNQMVTDITSMGSKLKNLSSHKQNVTLEENPDLKIGEFHSDGTIFAGRNPITNVKVYLMPTEHVRTSWNQVIFHDLPAMKNMYGYDGTRQIADTPEDDGKWRLPTMVELKHLHNMKDIIGEERFYTCHDGKRHRQSYWSCEAIYDRNSIEVMNIDTGTEIRKRGKNSGIACFVRTEPLG